MKREKAKLASQKRIFLAQRLREAREYVGLSQEEVATALGISRPAITHIEAGTRKVDALELDKLSLLYGQTVQYLLTGASLASDTRLAFLARATQGFSEKDLNELGRFAEFLRSSREAKRRSSS